MKFTLSILLTIFSLGFLLAQNEEQQFFKVEFDKFEIPTQDLIKSLENSRAMPFMAPDINGKQQFLGDYQGQVVFVYFWNGNCGVCQQQIASLNLLHQESANKMKVISILDEPKEEAATIAKSNGVQFPTLYNGKMLGEAAYGIELGYPRLFAIDGSGTIRSVIPSQTLSQSSDIYLQLKNLYELIDGE